MPKHEDEIFSNMKNSVLLIIIFTNFINCSDLNITEDELFPTCPFTIFRKKREQPEYTRWRANLESTQEFIVKVLDEDLTTPNTKKVIAVNIQPLIKGGEKIIIGGVMVPKPTTVTPTSDVTKDYTRFVPPTTVVTQVGGDLYLVPVQKPNPGVIKPIPARVKHPQRDESPPALPQFLPRTPVSSWQYAPITPVGFTRRTMSPVTPPLDINSLHNSNPKPTRTSPFDDFFIPTRTKSDYEELRRYQNFEDESDPFATRTAFIPKVDPGRTSATYDTTPAKEYGILLTNKKSLIQYDNEIIEDKSSDHSEADETYHMMFYNEDEENTKKAEKLDESYEDKNRDILENETDSATEIENLRKANAKSAIGYEEIEESENKTKTTTKSYNLDSISKVSMKEGLTDKRSPMCSMLKLRQLNFNSPRTLPEIVAQLKQWAEESPVAKWIDITDGNFTAMENPIYMMIVDDPSSGQIVTAKQTVMIVAGIQGRDQHAVAAALYVLYQLIERSEAHADLLTKYRFWIIPVFNPDGYDYSMTFPHRREWAKNLRQSWDECKGRTSCHFCDTYGLRCTIHPCYGVNLDRNFEYQWIPAEELRSEHPCGALYAGPRQLSEPETQALTRFLHEQKTPIYTFIAFKEGEVLGIMYPYSHTKKRRAFDHIYRQRASRAAAAAYSISGRPYVAGQTSEFLRKIVHPHNNRSCFEHCVNSTKDFNALVSENSDYRLFYFLALYAGGIEDWVDSHLGIDNTYTIVMFRPADTYNSKLVTERVVHEAYAAMDTLVLQSIEALGPPVVTLTRTRSASQSFHLSSKAILINSTAVLLAFISAFSIRTMLIPEA